MRPRRQAIEVVTAMDHRGRELRGSTCHYQLIFKLATLKPIILDVLCLKFANLEDRDPEQMPM